VQMVFRSVAARYIQAQTKGLRLAPTITNSQRLSSLPSSSFRSFCSEKNSAYEMLQVEKKGNVGLVTITRPKALNALCKQLCTEINHAMKTLDEDQSCDEDSR